MIPGAALRRPPGAIVAALLAVPLALAGISSAARAQATLRGRVVDSEFGQAVPDAVVRIRGLAEPLTTDSTGRFETPPLPSGEVQLTIEALGYATATFRPEIPSSGSVEQTFWLEFTGEHLPEVAVRARAERLSPRYLDFERRRERGLGTYLRWDEIYQKGYQSVGDALRTVRGIRIRCNQQTFECFAYLARTPQCLPAWWVDGMEVSSFHENTPIRDVYGIEVYRGAGEVPAEFHGSNSACGVIVIWTKSRPYQMR